MAAIEGQGVSAVTGANTAGLAFDSAGEDVPHMLFLHGWCGDRSFFARLLPGFEGPDPGTARRGFVEQMFLPTDDADRRARIVKTMCAVPDYVAIATTKAMAAFDAAAILRGCNVPVVVISSAVPTNGSAYLLEVNPAITIGQTVGAGHFLQLEVPEQVNPMIERFLSINLQASPQ